MSSKDVVGDVSNLRLPIDCIIDLPSVMVRSLLPKTTTFSIRSEDTCEDEFEDYYNDPLAEDAFSDISFDNSNQVTSKLFDDISFEDERGINSTAPAIPKKTGCTILAACI